MIFSLFFAVLTRETKPAPRLVFFGQIPSNIYEKSSLDGLPTCLFLLLREMMGVTGKQREVSVRLIAL
jgi:hypothetical protein